MKATWKGGTKRHKPLPTERSKGNMKRMKMRMTKTKTSGSGALLIYKPMNKTRNEGNLKKRWCWKQYIECTGRLVEVSSDV